MRGGALYDIPLIRCFLSLFFSVQDGCMKRGDGGYVVMIITNIIHAIYACVSCNETTAPFHEHSARLGVLHV